ncbi:MAG TPA: hypothetical protein VMF11_15970 [Candidatus Baltobacteraceae bacterium]|nr:hypothetical protein [Candidatus Baltobacteraceae bacterium]
MGTNRAYVLAALVGFAPFFAVSALAKAAGASGAVPTVDVQFEGKFAAVPEDVARVLSVREQDGVTILHVLTSVCGFGKGRGLPMDVRVRNARGYTFRVGELVVTAAIQRNKRWIGVIRPVPKSEEWDLDCVRRKT